MNSKKIADYIRSGATTVENIGVEIEHFIIGGDGKSVSYYGERGIGRLLAEITPFFNEKIYSEGELIALSNCRWHLTLEPAAQLEISIEPCGYIDEIKARYDEFLNVISPVLKKYNYRLVTMGYQPSDKVDDLKLIPKKRYELMDRYFKKSGHYGRNMMRGTASSQVSIDYSDENDCIQKFRLANALVPLFSLITDNSPVFEGKPYNGRMIRTKIWADVDNSRCGIVPCLENFSIEKYADYILKNPAILIEENGDYIYTGAKPIGEIYKSKEMTVSEIEHVLSMFFPDVRLKKYIEIRPADSMPIEYTLSYAALIKGIFKKTAEVSVWLGVDNITSKDISAAKDKLIKYGFDGKIYNKTAAEILKYLINIAEKTLDDKDKKYLAEIKEIIYRKKTLKERYQNA